MGNETALFEDDFGTEFEDVFNEDTLTGANDFGPVTGAASQPVQAVAGFVAKPTTAPVSNFMPLEQGGDAMLPAISIKLFYEREETRALMQLCAKDRRMGRATVDCIPGGIPAAVAELRNSATPNLLMVESSAQAVRVLAEIDTLAEFCDEHVKVLVIGAVNDIALYRQLVARGVSEYIVPPFQPLQIIRSISRLFTDPEAPFLGKQISVVGAKGGVGASTVAHNLAFMIATNFEIATTLVDLDLHLL
jgi:pilus assembly protein CpaE